MLKKMMLLSGITGVLTLSLGTIAPAAPRENADSQSQEQVYGSQLMTQGECDAYRAGIYAAKTMTEREEIRRAHRRRMQKLADDCGITLLDELQREGRW